MPKGPRGEKRPADVIGAAIRVARIATGEEADTIEDDGKDKAAFGDIVHLLASGKDKAAKALGRKGGEARAERLTPERRAEIARKAAERRWRDKAKVD